MTLQTYNTIHLRLTTNRLSHQHSRQRRKLSLEKRQFYISSWKKCSYIKMPLWPCGFSLKHCRVYSNSLKMSKIGDFPWSWFLTDRTYVEKEKQKFVLACLRPL